MDSIAARKKYRWENFVNMEVDTAKFLLQCVSTYDTQRPYHDKEDDINLALIRRMQDEIKTHYPIQQQLPS